MPLIHRKSKEALQKNIKTEMDANPGKSNRAQNLAIAYNTQKMAGKKKRMSGGGKVDANKPRESLMVEDGVGSSESEPNLSRYADGGEVNPSLSMSKRGENSSMKPLMRNSQMTSEGPVPPRKPDDERLDQSEYMDSQWGGKPGIPRGPKDDIRLDKKDYMGDQATGSDDADEHYSSIADAILSKKRKKMATGGPAEDVQGSSTGGQSPKTLLADGGVIGEGVDETDSESRESRRSKLPEGAVDIEQNAEIEPNFFYHQNEDAALKENYDMSLEDATSPMDSAQHGDDFDDRDKSDKMDMVDQIRKKMKTTSPGNMQWKKFKTS